MQLSPHDASARAVDRLVLVLAAWLATAAAFAAETGSACLNGIDDDADGLTDCADPDCESAARPGEVTRLDVSRASETLLLRWSTDEEALGPATVHDVVVGDLSRLGDGGARCLFDSRMGGPAISGGWLDEDLWLLPRAAYFLVRAENACGTGTFGTDSLGLDRLPPEIPCGPAMDPLGCDGGPVPGTASAWTPCDVMPRDSIPVYLSNLHEDGTGITTFENNCWPWPVIETLILGVWEQILPDWSCPDWCTTSIDLPPGATHVDDSFSRLFGDHAPPGLYRVTFHVGVGACDFDPHRCERYPRDCEDEAFITTPPFLVR